MCTFHRAQINMTYICFVADLCFVNSVAAVIQAQVFEDDNLDDERKLLFTEFNFIPELPADVGGHIDTIPERILIQKERRCL